MQKLYNLPFLSCKRLKDSLSGPSSYESEAFDVINSTKSVQTILLVPSNRKASDANK